MKKLQISLVAYTVFLVLAICCIFAPDEFCVNTTAIEITPYDEKQDLKIERTKEAQINYAMSDSILAKELETKIKIYEAIIGTRAIAALSLGIWVFKNKYRGGNSQ